MPDIQPISLSYGTVFEFPDPIAESTFRGWFRERDFEFDEDRESGLSIGPGGVQVSNIPPGLLGRKDGFGAFYRPNADLDGYPDGSFITIKDEEKSRYSEVIDEVEYLWEKVEELGISDQIAVVELTLEGRIAISSSNELSMLYKDDALSIFEGLSGKGATGTAARLEADSKPNEFGWYKFDLDGKPSKNPRIWAFKFQYRQQSYDDFKKEEIEGAIMSLVELTEANS